MRENTFYAIPAGSLPALSLPLWLFYVETDMSDACPAWQTGLQKPCLIRSWRQTKLVRRGQLGFSSMRSLKDMSGRAEAQMGQCDGEV
jgi:hypothetical protein